MSLKEGEINGLKFKDCPGLLGKDSDSSEPVASKIILEKERFFRDIPVTDK